MSGHHIDRDVRLTELSLLRMILKLNPSCYALVHPFQSNAQCGSCLIRLQQSAICSHMLILHTLPERIKICRPLHLISNVDTVGQICTLSASSIRLAV